MAVSDKSYSYSNQERDVSDILSQLIASYPTFLSRVAVGRPTYELKYEWPEEQLTPTESAIASFDTDGDGTGVNVASTAGMRAGMILGVRAATGASHTELLQIASVDSATDLTVTRDYGSTTGVTLVVGNILFNIGAPQNEGSTGTASDTTEPSIEYNYTQIFERMASLSRSAKEIKIYGIDDALDRKVMEQMTTLMREMNNSAIYGVRVARSASVRGTMGGWLSYVNVTGGNVIDASSSALTEANINDALEDIFEDGGISDRYAILTSHVQARKISAFNTAGSNPMVMKQNTDRSLGGYIDTFIGDLPATRNNGMGSFMAEVIVDPNFPRDMVGIVDLNKVKLVPLAGSTLTDSDATLPTYDGFSRRLIGEYTMEVNNGKHAHAVIKGLTI